MADKPGCSTNLNKTQDEGLSAWTRDLKLLTSFTYDKLNKHLGLVEKPSNNKDEKLGYRLFKEGYIKNTQVKPNIPNGKVGTGAHIRGGVWGV